MEKKSSIPIVTLLTDFGYQDGFVGVMKGVMLTVNPSIKIIDISHEIPPHDIQSASFVLGQAYAYFLIQSINISDKARSRLDAIREFADLGSGYKLAEFDLRLRGAGSLLGNKQHGHIEALGFDYYHKMLNKTIKELKGEIDKKGETHFKIYFSYSIYVSS